MKIYRWYLYMEAITQLGVGLSIGYLSSLSLGLILMRLACYVSLHGESDNPLETVVGALQTHTSDIADFVESNLTSLPPVLNGHSFGGLIVQFYLANAINKHSLGTTNAFPQLSGAWIKQKFVATVPEHVSLP